MSDQSPSMHELQMLVDTNLQMSAWRLFYQYRFYGKDQDQCIDLGICQDRRRRGRQGIRCLDGITDSYSCP